MTEREGRWNRAAKVLVFVLVVLNVVGLAYNVRAAAYIRDSSTSVTTDILLRLVYFGFMAGISVTEVLLVDQLAFRGAWRTRVLGGLRGRAILAVVGDDSRDSQVQAPSGTGGGEDEEERHLGAVAAVMRDYTPHVSVLFLAFLGFNYLLFNWVNAGFDSYYRQVGMLYTELRSPTESRRVAAIGALASKRRADVSAKLLERLEKGTRKEKIWACWALGYRAAYGLLPGDLRSTAERAILPLVSSGDMVEGGVAAVALARLESYQWLDPAVRALGDDDPDLRFALALGLLQDSRPQALSALGSILSRVTKGRLARACVWALGEIKSASSAAVIERSLFKLDPRGRCIAVEGLGRLGRRASVPTLVRFFESKLSDVRCPQVEEKLRPDEQGDRLYLYYWGSRAYKPLGCVARREPLRVRILKVLWRIGDKGILPWVRSLAEADDYAPAVKDCAVRVYNASVD